MNTEDEDEYVDYRVWDKEELYEHLNTIETADDFGGFMMGLSSAYDHHRDLAPRKEPSTFLADVGSIASDIEKIAKDEDLDEPGPIDWQWLGLIVLRAMNR